MVALLTLLGPLLGFLKPFLMPILGGIGGLVGAAYMHHQGSKEQKAKDTQAQLASAVTASLTRQQIDAAVAASAPPQAQTGAMNEHDESNEETPAASSAVTNVGSSGGVQSIDRLRDKWSRD